MKVVRDGQIVWPYCPRCGCRLEMKKTEHEEFYFRHYEGGRSIFSELMGLDAYVDARGCICVDDVWALDDKILSERTSKNMFF